MKIAIYGRPFTENFIPVLEKLMKRLVLENVEVIIYEPFYQFLSSIEKLDVSHCSGIFHHGGSIKKDVDFMFVIGGDGTFLETISYTKDNQTPIIGINSGRLGFLTNIGVKEVSKALDSLFKGDYYFEERTLLTLRTDEGLFGDYNYALNELTVQKKGSSSMISIHTFINDDYLNSYWSDGLIICTPTGSTAYSLSVGGPLVMPNSRNFVITPIAPHSLTVRPLVLSDNNVISLKVDGRDNEFLVSLDYRHETFTSDVELCIRRADFMVKIVKFPQNDYFSTLRTKLMWGLDKRNYIG